MPQPKIQQLQAPLQQNQITRERVLEATLTNPSEYYLGAALDDLLAYAPGEGPERLKRILGFIKRLHDIESTDRSGDGAA